jgi:hypothetical protein
MTLFKTIKYIDPIQFGKVYSIITFTILFLLFVPISILFYFLRVFTGVDYKFIAKENVLALVIGLVFYLIFGFLMGIVIGIIYNKTFQFHNGIKIQLEDQYDNQ